MTTTLDGAVELLDRSLAFTRVALADVGPDNLHRPTPCLGWDLGRLLAHMEDALDAFAEAAAGKVEVDPVPETHTRVEALREKACALLGAWASARPATVRVGDAGLDAATLVATAALEITVHGWDVGQATGRGARIPDDLARGLLDVARYVVDAGDRGPRFAPPAPVAAGAAPDIRLLAWLGRRVPGQLTGPPQGNRAVHPAPRGVAS